MHTASGAAMVGPDERARQKARDRGRRGRPGWFATVVLALTLALTLAFSGAVTSPAAAATGDPIGYLEQLSSPAPGHVAVKGWALDQDAPLTPIQVHVYLGGPPGAAGAEAVALVANQSRPDVGTVYPGTGSNHGYAAEFATQKAGSVPVYVYAINAAGTPGNPVLLGTYTVVVKPAYQPLAPSRVLDSRSGNGVATTAPLAAGSTTVLQIAGRGGVPTTGVDSVVLNVTVTAPETLGYVSVYPTGAARPTISNLNYSSGQTIANQVVATLGAGGTISVFTSAQTHVVADVAGYYPSGGAYTGLVPSRIVDTRAPLGVPSRAQVPAGGTISFPVTGVGGVPPISGGGIGAVILNVTATNPASFGFLTVYPMGLTRPPSSNVNYVAGQTMPGMVVAAVVNQGWVTIYSSATTDVVVDLMGWIPLPADYTATTTRRILDTRVGIGAAAGIVPAGGVVPVKVTGTGAIPATGVRAVMLNVTETQASNVGFVTVYPSDAARPLSSNLNHLPYETIANSVIAKVGPDGYVNVYTNSSAHLIVDISGYWS